MNDIKIRKQWEIKPFSKPHSTKKGKKGYDRKKMKKDLDFDRDF